MKKAHRVWLWLVVVTIVFLWNMQVAAHFGGLIPSNDIVGMQDNKTIVLAVKFFHPMENTYMEMQKPQKFGVMIDGQKFDLLDSLQGKKGKGPEQTEYFTWWQAEYTIRKPGDHIFYVEPEPYWEPAEDCYIVHYTKVYVNALGLEVGWEDEIGLETEIVPLTRPYGLWTGNIFTGIVKLRGEVVPYAEVEVEYYNQDGLVEVPAEPYITQVVKADKNGVFSYAMPKAGWWGFAALSEAPWTRKGPDGEEKAVEIGAVIWVRTRDMK
ncbi:DUF4198 domain-containing protein [Candidatus Aerophobetes bacterium]|nr:DUF4198 domain-containing protein [Candidatus Aerophobetes bacterium]